MTKHKKDGGASASSEELVLDGAVYSSEAVRLAAHVFSGRTEPVVKAEKGAFRVSLNPGGEELAGEFLNEVLNQQCRLDLAAKNSRIAGIIVTKALLSAAGEK